MPNIEAKKKVVAELQQKLENAALVVFTDYRGLTVDEMTALRNKLRSPGVEYQVIKNTMMEFALKNTGHEDVIEHISGPNAVIFSSEDPVGPAKNVYEFIKEYKKLEVKVGILEGQLVGAEKIKALADLPSKEVLVAQVLGTLQAPITNLVYVLNANLTGLVRALDQIREQKQAS
ncbi:MAG TPA: 50S ribosomal protein L10 [Syntrophomonadaceae bacterium]|nr:50S ribosomal protein L10 [Syntrophomonadaceae bacterium]HQA07960.1 50S ribosomal protein L10 [Syntrophomonadaceae bacterium]HQE23777.1 50S ribosomal protein L10 [Syntrophomonadaceae bacterium]